MHIKYKLYFVIKIIFVATLTIFSQGHAFAQSCTPAEKLIGTEIYNEDFGTGAGRSTNPNVVNHTFAPTGIIQDDFYAVGRSIDLAGTFMRTDVIGDVDDDGASEGRYLGVNIRGRREPGGFIGEIFRLNNQTIPTISGFFISELEFSIALSGTCFSCSQSPNVELQIIDSSSGTLLDSDTFNAPNNDQWTPLNLNSDVPIDLTSVDIAIVNLVAVGNAGNDIGIDNIILRPIYCPSLPDLVITKLADQTVNVPVGTLLTYTYTVTNTGNVPISNIQLIDIHNGSNPAPTPSGENLTNDNGVIGDSSDNTPNDGIWDSLAPGDVITFTGTYSVTQNDVDNLQ